jgi:nitrite reductase/ring-hydroxylating ferredoxin subunit
MNQMSDQDASLQPAGYIWAARVSDLVLEVPFPVVVADIPIALYRMNDGIFATEDVCTHGFAALTEGWIVGDVVECPLHGGAFEVRTGKAAKLPCTEDLRTFQVSVVGNDIYVAV